MAVVVGHRVRSLREDQGLSLRELAVRSSVSAPMLSQVERGTTSPTLAVAEKIADGLGLTLSQLLRLDEAPPFEIVRADARPQGAEDGHSWEMLTADHPGQRVAVSRHRLEPRAAPGGAPMHRAGSREFALVERGPVTLELDGAAHALGTGDSVIFDADLAHRFRAGDQPAVIVSVVTAGLRRS
jgi:transcriptional regulator with XRE-family HTH domain